jgi:biotin-(acetyl-CoA carboxylase) ligase
VLPDLAERDDLLGRPVRTDAGAGVAAGIDERGRLLVDTADGRLAVESGEIVLTDGTP